MKNLIILLLSLTLSTSVFSQATSYNFADSLWESRGFWTNLLQYTQKDSFTGYNDNYFNFFNPNIGFKRHGSSRNDGVPVSLAWLDNSGNLMRSPTTSLVLSLGQITTGLGYTPLSGINSSDVITALGFTPITNARTVTINGVTLDLSANRSWTIGGTLPSIGTANQLLRVNTGATSPEWFTPTFISGNETITLSGDVAGVGTTSITTTLANSGVSAGTYEFITVNSKGIVTGGYNSVTNTLSPRTAGMAYQCSNTSRTYDLDFTINIQIGATLISTSDARVTLEISANGSTGWAEYARGRNANSGVLAAQNDQTNEIIAFNIPAGYYYRLVYTNTTGTTSWTYINGHETLRR